MAWGVRSDYFDPRAGRVLWSDDLATLGKNYLCNSHLCESEQKAWFVRGVYKGSPSVLELDVRFRDSECDQFLPFESPLAVSYESVKDSTIFLDEKPVGKATLDLSPAHHHSSIPVPADFRRIHFKLFGLEEHQVRQLQVSVEACPTPERYESDFDPRTGIDRRKQPDGR